MMGANDGVRCSGLNRTSKGAESRLRDRVGGGGRFVFENTSINFSVVVLQLRINIT